MISETQLDDSPTWRIKCKTIIFNFFPALRSYCHKLETKKLLQPYLGEFIIGAVLSCLMFGRVCVLPPSFLSNTQQAGNLTGLINTEELPTAPNLVNQMGIVKTAYAFYENTTVDGSPIPLNEEEDDEEGDDYYLLVDKTNLMAVYSPYNSLVPEIQRHGIIIYKVEAGDTVGKIAAEFNIDPQTIIWANNLPNKAVIVPGQELVVLPVSGVKHVVKKGDTVSSLALKYKVSEENIVNYNGIDKTQVLKVGDELIIPGGKLVTSSGSTAKVSSNSKASTSKTTTSSLAKSNGLMPMTDDISTWPTLSGYYIYPTSGGWNKGIYHYYNATDIINACGSPIYAAASGLVTQAVGGGGYNLGFGNLIKIQHYNGTLTVYAHLRDVLVQVGDQVEQGALIGHMGDTGNANGCHLHFEVRGAQNPFVLRK